MPFTWVKTSSLNGKSWKCGTLLDSCSSDDFITHTAAQKLGLRGKKINLITEGFGGRKSHVPEAKLYDVVVKLQDGRSETITFYGVDKYGTKETPPDKQ